MKKTTTIICTLLALLMLVSCLFAACGKKRTPLTAESFSSALEAKGYTVADVTNTTSGGENTNGIYVARNKETGLQVELYIMKSETDGAAVYLSNVNNAKSDASGNSTNNSVSLGSFEKYSQTDDSTFYMIARVGATMLYCKTDKANADAAKALFEELGYK